MQEIKRNKWVHIKVLLFGLLGQYTLISYAIQAFHSETLWSKLLLIALILIILLILILLLNSVTELLNPRAGLIIDKNGLTDHVSFTATGFIPWDQISEVYIERFFGNDHLVIKLKDTYTITDNATFLKKPLSIQTKEKFGNAILINKDYVQKSLFEIENLIDERRFL